MRIVGGAWEGGAPLPNEDELAAELGVSRTVVREAIKALQAKGLVEVRPKTGTRVRPRRAWHLLDADVVAWQFADMERADDLRELYEVRASIAAAAARLAATRRTTEQLTEIEAQHRRDRRRGSRAARQTPRRPRLPRCCRRRRAQLAARPRRRDGPRRARGRGQPGARAGR